jgi:hypothetical protein
MLQAYPFAEEGMERISQVPGRKDARPRGLEVLVGENTVVGLQAPLLGEVGPRLRPDTDYDDVAGDHVPVGQTDAFGRSRTHHGLGRDAEMHFDPMVAVDVSVELAHFGP